MTKRRYPDGTIIDDQREDDPNFDETGINYSGQLKDVLVEIAQERNIEVPPRATKEDLVVMLKAYDANPPVVPPQGPAVGGPVPPPVQTDIDAPPAQPE